jgi:cell division protease FtsH
MSHTIRNITGAAIILALLCGVLYGSHIKNQSPPEYRPYTDFIALTQSGEVSAVNLSDAARFTFWAGESPTLYITDNPRRENFKEELLLSGIYVTESTAGNGDAYVQLGLTVVLVAGGLYLLRRRQGYGKLTPKSINTPVASGTQGASTGCGFDDIAGNLEAKESVADIIDFLREPQKFSRYGARMPRGILLHGKPGTGKTLMARAMAGEAGVPFFAVSGSDFVQMYVGVGAARVRELFGKAREGGKAVIFIDEIDALGKHRSGAVSGGNDEREQTLNALLTEMSGFSAEEGIVVVAATNRPDTLDEALLRPGRFDRKIEINLPDINARRQILGVHAKNKPLSGGICLDKLAKDTVFFSGAMLEGLLNDAAINAARFGRESIQPCDIETAYYTALAGPEKKDRSHIQRKEREVTAWHEAGHALAAKLVSPGNHIAKVSIIPSSGGVGGFCVSIPPERMYVTKKELESQIMVSLAGRGAEELKFGAEQVTTGAGNDIEKATQIVVQYVTRFGMGGSLLNLSQFAESAAVIKECKDLTRRLYDAVVGLLQAHFAKLETLANTLLEKETVDGEVIERIMQA